MTRLLDGRHHPERFTMEQAGEVDYLITWRDNEFAGRVILTPCRRADANRRCFAFPKSPPCLRSNRTPVHRPHLSADGDADAKRPRRESDLSPAELRAESEKDARLEALRGRRFTDARILPYGGLALTFDDGTPITIDVDESAERQRNRPTRPPQ